MRPPNHMPCPPDEATVAKLGEVTFEKYEARWKDSGIKYVTGSTKDLTRYGATFYKPVPNPPENTRELTEEEWKARKFDGWILCIGDDWVRGSWDTNGVSKDEPWRCRVPIEKKVVAWKVGDPDNPGYSVSASFATEELRDRAVREANGRES